MAQFRIQVATWASARPMRDAVTNTFYIDTDLSFFGPSSSLAQDTTALWAARNIQGFDRCRALVYNMADAEPRLPREEHVRTVTGKSMNVGPREVALCLSYYAGVNRPRRRGRMYLGPFGGANMAERPAPALVSDLLLLADGISGLGGANAQWVQYSPTTGEFHNVTNSWIDDEWDTMRSRGLRGEARQVKTHDG